MGAAESIVDLPNFHPSHIHALQRYPGDDGWKCDGSQLPGGCRRGITDFHQTKGVPRFRCCVGCDYVS